MIFKSKKKINENILPFDFSRKGRIRRYLELVAGVFVLALAFNLFMLPNRIVSGFSGIAVIFSSLFNLDASVFILFMTVILLIVGIFALGKEKIMLTIFGALLYPALVKLTEPLINYITIDNSDVLLSVLFGGLFRAGFSTGGSDTLIQIMNKYLNISLGKANLIINIIIISGGVFAFGWTRLMYSLVCLYIVSLVMDRIILGISNSKSFYIITEHEAEIKTYIMQKLGRGVTAIEARGGFTNNKEKILMCIVPTREYFILKNVVNKIDKNAVLLITDVYETKGSR